jgi:CheY-like chemotaxis protein
MGEETREVRVLVVDDDEAIRLLMADVLSEARCHVLTASDGAEAVEILEERSVDLVITDDDMPRMNGLELIRWSRARLPHVSTVMITAHDPQTMAAEGWKHGASRILLKPFSDVHLLLLLGELRRAALAS